MSVRHGKVLRLFSLISSLGAVMALNMIVPTPVKAEPRQIQLLLSSQGNQNFEALVRQAESVVSNVLGQAFAENPRSTEISVMIVGERNGVIVPLLSANVSRSNWQATPIVQAWTRYFSSAEVLLGFATPRRVSPLPATSFDPVAASMLDREPNFYH